MKIFKITNITNTYNKRDVNYNLELKIDYIDGLNRDVLNLKPGETMFLKTNKLSIKIHNLRLKKLIIVEEISELKLKKILNKDKIKKELIKIDSTTIKEEKKVETKTPTKKTNTKKEKPVKKSETEIIS